jgi:two-component sensor histidine kinase
MNDENPSGGVAQLLDTPNLADALESDQFKQFLDRVPIAIAVSELTPSERLVYANIEFENLTGRSTGNHGEPAWGFLRSAGSVEYNRVLGEAIAEERDYLGTFLIANADRENSVDAWSNVIKNDDDIAVYRLVALVERADARNEDRAEFEKTIETKDTLLRELQHRVKNNLQMITALIRMEARNVQDEGTGERFARLAGRIESLTLLYQSLSVDDGPEAVDLGIYLSQVASAVMRAHAMEGIRLDLKVDTWPVSIDVAMPAGLVVNELLTNALKHAFAGRDRGTITLHSLVDAHECRVIVADDGIGFQDGASWPAAGKLGTLIVKSLRQNAKADVAVTAEPGQGVRVVITFKRQNAAPEPTPAP